MLGVCWCSRCSALDKTRHTRARRRKQFLQTGFQLDLFPRLAKTAQFAGQVTLAWVVSTAGDCHLKPKGSVSFFKNLSVSLFLFTVCLHVHELTVRTALWICLLFSPGCPFWGARLDWHLCMLPTFLAQLLLLQAVCLPEIAATC